MKTVRQILKQKGSEVYSVDLESSVYEALTKMKEKNVGALLVMDDWKLAGVFSERDCARNISLQERPLKETKVKDFMTELVATVNPDTNIFDCMSMMTDKRIRHLPVLQNNELVGIISIGDVVNAIIHEQDMTIRDLKNYISGQS